MIPLSSILITLGIQVCGVIFYNTWQLDISYKHQLDCCCCCCIKFSICLLIDIGFDIILSSSVIHSMLPCYHGTNSSCLHVIKPTVKHTFDREPNIVWLV